MKHFAMIALVLVACGATAQAVPTATFSVTTSGSNWYLWCSTDSQSNGLVSFILDLNGTSGTQILTSAIKAPRYFSQALDRSAGFAAYASGGVVSAGHVTGILAGQWTMYGDTPNPLSDARVIQGIGQVAGGAIELTENGPVPVSWDATCLLAQGTYSGQGSFAAVNMDGNFLSKVNGDRWAGPGNVEAGNWEFVPMQAYLPGDCNKDGYVKFADYLILEQNFGKSGKTWAEGDFTGDGWVKFADYLALEQSVNRPRPPIWATPEPATMSLLVLGGVGLLKRRAA